MLVSKRKEEGEYQSVREKRVLLLESLPSLSVSELILIA